MNSVRFSTTDIETAVKGEWLNGICPEKQICGITTDTRNDCSDAFFVALKGEFFDAHNFLDKAIAAGSAVLCVNRSFALENLTELPIPVFLVEDTLLAYQALAKYYRQSLSELQVAAVTGSMGKTSCKEIIKSIFAEAAGYDYVYATRNNTNNQVGVPQNIFNLTKKHQLCVLEMGTNHFGEIEPISKTAEPDVAVITAIAPCHLEFLRDLKGVAEEKSKIFSGLKSTGTAIIPYSCPQNVFLRKKVEKFRVLTFGYDPAADVQSEYLGGGLNGSRIRVTFNSLNGESFELKWQLSGAHQALNAAAAVAVALAMGISPKHIIEGLKKCVLPGMRMKIESINGTNWINDAYNASPDSMVAAIDWLAEFSNAEDLLLVLGDMLELGDRTAAEHTRILNHAFAKFPQAAFCLIGRQMYNSGCNLDLPENTFFFNDSEAASPTIKCLSQDRNSVFLKASRGMKLEKVLPENEKTQ
ncbi:UDP-N-acetylmuramoyl-tripeptide--D-alanyl-D-alanine ligase [Lentisphaerota bacterium ZTH]|nr:UDP-N-acetylmuramoyl-tripeptide--D-alanyl-D-alanine ligase [Lentisphaerota bacterium]WET05279.1 UDP-N-acetylmuramoyl-tripeptide--D-alanyl-D-alanine ligase [Lentisphaerota bacterium ZTH]